MGKPELKSGSLQLDAQVNKKVNPFLNDDGFYKLSGFHLDEVYSISKWKGFQKFNHFQLLENGTPAVFTGLFQYIKNDGIKQSIAMTINGVYAYGTTVGNAWNFAFSISSFNSTANNLFDGAMFNNILYFGNGITDNYKYDGDTFRTMGIAGPSAAQTASFTASAGSSGVLTGVYQYKVTFYNSTLGHESNPSDDNTASRSVSVTLSSQEGSLTGIPVSSDSQVNARKIYRTTADGAVWLYLDTIHDNTTTTYTDNTPDTSLGVAIDTYGNGVPPKFVYIKIWKGYAFMVPQNSSRIYFSKVNSPNAVDSNDFRDLDMDDGTIITGMKRLHDTLVVYKGSSIWVASGEDRNTFSFTKLVPDIGSVSNGIVSVPGKNVLLFPAKSSFRSFSGYATAEIAGLGIQKDYRALNQGRLSLIRGVAYEEKGVCMWLTSSGASSQGDTIFWYDYIQDKWGTRDISNVAANVISTMYDSSGRERLYIGGYNGFVWEGDVGGSDDGVAISCEVIDRAHPKNDPNPEHIKCFYHIFLWFNPVVGSTINVSYALDDPEGQYLSAGTIDASLKSGQDHVHFKALGRRIYLKFSESSKLQGHVLRGWRIYYKDMGRHNAA